MDLQSIFYVVAIISLGLMAIFMIFLLIMAASIATQIQRVLNKAEMLGEEAHAILDNVREYSEQLGISLVGKIFHAIVKAVRKNRRSSIDDEE